MEPLQITGTLLVIVAILAMIWSQQVEQKERYDLKRARHSLLEFYHYVADCEIDGWNFALIDRRLKNERSRLEMSDPEFCNIVNDIGVLFERRFSGFAIKIADE